MKCDDADKILYTAKDADPSILDGRKIVVMGYGNQGRPQAMNLRDSGFSVTVSARRGGEGWKKAVTDGFPTVTIEEGAASADVLMLLLPDEIHGPIYNEYLRGSLKSGASLCFAHGFSVAFGQVPAAGRDLILVAPKGQGEALRSEYLKRSGLPCLLGIGNEESGTALETALAIAWGLGCLRVGAFRTTFREEAVSDIFGEQAVLCGGVTALVKKAFEVLARRGFSPEVAYFECFQELKIIVDLFTRLGLAGMRDLTSRTAAYGGLKYGEALVSKDTEKIMEEIFERIDSGEFARDWLAEASSGKKDLERLCRMEREHPIERAGENVRRLYSAKGSRRSSRKKEKEDEK